MNINKIIESVRRKRKEKKLTQEQLAKKAGISRITVNRFENGNYNDISFKIVLKILDALGLEFEIKEHPKLKTLNEIYKERKKNAKAL